MTESGVSYKKLGLVLLLIAVIVIYFLLYNKWERFTTMGVLARGAAIANQSNGREGFTSLMNSSASVLKATDSPLGYQGIEDGSYTVDTLPETMLNYINPILAQVLNQINAKTGARYYLRKIDRANVQPISKGFVGCEQATGQLGSALKSACQSVDAAGQELQLGVRYTVDFFAHELTNQDTHRFIVVFTANSKGEIQVEHFNIANGQLHPDKMFAAANEPIPDPLAKPDNLILTDRAFSRAASGNQSIMGMPTSSLDFSPFKMDGAGVSSGNPGGWSDSAMLGQIFLPGVFHANGLPANAPLATAPTSLDEAITQQPPFDPNWPQRKHGRWWDEFGVANVESAKCDSQTHRAGLDHAIDIRPPQPYDNPTVVRSEGNAYENQNHWLFDRARGSLRQASQ